MERRQLEYFLAVVERSGFTSAAHALHVTQPSLSHGIACLEREVGAPLFHRLSRGATLTAAGEALVGPARQVLRDFGTAHAAVQHVAGLTAGHLDIVSLTTLAVHPLALLAGSMQQRDPRVDLRISGPPHSKAIPDMVRAGVHEIGLTDSARNLEGLESLRLRSDEMLLVLAGDGPDLPDPFPLASLAGLPLVAAPVGSSTRELVDRFLAARGGSARIAVEVSHWAAIVPLVQAGAGVALLPTKMADDASRYGARVHATDPPLVQHVRLVWRGGALSPAVAALLDLARELDLVAEDPEPQPPVH